MPEARKRKGPSAAQLRLRDLKKKTFLFPVETAKRLAIVAAKEERSSVSIVLEALEQYFQKSRERK